MNSLILIYEASAKKFEESQDSFNLTGQWCERVSIPPYYYPVMFVVGQDLLVTFPDIQRIIDIFSIEIMGMTLASVTESKCFGTQFHEGFLRNLTRVSCLFDCLFYFIVII